jgi:hypothetical protein
MDWLMEVRVSYLSVKGDKMYWVTTEERLDFLLEVLEAKSLEVIDWEYV